MPPGWGKDGSQGRGPWGPAESSWQQGSKTRTLDAKRSPGLTHQPTLGAGRGPSSGRAWKATPGTTTVGAQDRSGLACEVPGWACRAGMKALTAPAGKVFSQLHILVKTRHSRGTGLNCGRCALKDAWRRCQDPQSTPLWSFHPGRDPSILWYQL